MRVSYTPDWKLDEESIQWKARDYIANYNYTMSELTKAEASLMAAQGLYDVLDR